MQTAKDKEKTQKETTQNQPTNKSTQETYNQKGNTRTPNFITQNTPPTTKNHGQQH